MDDTYINAAYHSVCENATPAGVFYVSLYVSHPFYGGPEEGGWWGEDDVLVATQKFPTEELAEQVKEEVLKKAEELNSLSKRDFGEQCLREIEWCDARLIDDYNYLGEVDGEDNYWVAIEKTPGEHERQGCRHYE